MPKPWTITSKDPGTDYGVFRVRSHTAEHPITGVERTFRVVESVEWVNVIAITDAGRVVLVRQFRHGVERVTVEIPGGLVDPGESPLEAAVRELAEETGYTATRWEELGRVQANPAIQNNQCWSYLATGARLTEAQHLDEGEDIEVVALQLEAVRSALIDGRIRHSLVASAFLHYVNRFGWRLPPNPKALPEPGGAT